MANLDIIISIRLTAEQHERVKALATESNIGVGSWIRAAIDDAVERRMVIRQTWLRVAKAPESE